MCSLGNLFFDEKLNKMYPKLKILNIESDEFGNRGLKTLMLNYNPNLTSITFINTNLTTDCLKILNKKFSC